jgi:hypothetical protein
MDAHVLLLFSTWKPPPDTSCKQRLAKTDDPAFMRFA